MTHFSFSVTAQDIHTKARVGELMTPHGVIHTPVFMPVGTQATVKSLDPNDLEIIDAQIILGNTYHLYLRPGEKIVKEFGGLHRFMNWHRPILTDSGGYQVTSLGLGKVTQKTEKNHTMLTKIDDDGVTFQSHWDGSFHRFTPEKAIQIQEDLGADIIMAFDEATPKDATYEYTQTVLAKTHAWAKRSLAAKTRTDQALFGIIQGGFYSDLRRESAKFIASLPFQGIAVGGGDIGSDLEKTEKILDWIADLLPKEKPLYAMGVGVYPQDVIDIIKMGVDMFDCVGPTRLARTGLLFTGRLKEKDSWFIFDSPYAKGRITVGKKEFERDKRPIDEYCQCYTCRTFTRGYIHHLFHVNELLAYRLGTIHNVHFMVTLVTTLREVIIKRGNKSF